MATLDRLERLTDLVLVLLDASTPRTLEDIVHAVPGYPEGHEACRQAFERDKRVLREEGIPVVTEPVEGPEQFGYRIDPEAFYLPDLGLAPDEQAALHLAVAGVHLGDPSGRHALAKLGAVGVAEARPVAAVVPPPALVPLFAALRSGAEVTFGYHGRARRVAPASVRFRGGRWYLVGWDAERQGARTFRIDRIEGAPEPGAAGSGTLPEGFDAEVAPLEPWRLVEGEEDEHVLVLVDPVEAPRVVSEVGESAVQARRPDGSVVLRLGVTSFAVLRSWVLGLLDHAEVVGPSDARAAVIAWLDAMVAQDAVDTPPVAPRLGAGAPPRRPTPGEAGSATGSGSGTDPGQHSGSGSDHDHDPAQARPPARRPLPASDRLRRLLAVVAWLAEVGEATIAEISARFDISEDEVGRELELAACCGLPPYSPDVLLEIMVSEESVSAFLPKELARPRRLSPAEGLALAASARTILAVPGADADGALGRALGKLEAVLGDPRRLVIELDAPPLLDAVRTVTERRVQAEIEYHSASTDETTVRVVDPLAVASLDGHWYLDAYCQRAEGVRRFRVDRIRALRPSDVPVAHAEAAGGVREEAFVPGPGSLEVRLWLGPEARWVADTVPVVADEPGPGGSSEVVLAVGGLAWLERLLLQLGPHARVLGPPELAGTGRRAAARVRRRYG